MNFYEDKIEAYLAGKLNAADTQALEEGMRKDPLLNNEVELQRDIIESLKNSRKIQLKNRLNNIDVTSTSTGVSSAVKIAASFITVGIVGAGIYYFSVLSTDKSKDNVTVVLSENVQAPQVQNNEANIIKDNTVTTGTVEAGVTKNQLKPSVANKNTNNAIARNNSSAPEITAQANVPNGVIAETESDRVSRDMTINIPDGSISQESAVKVENPDVSVDDRNKKDFSYVYTDNKLYLIGDFNDQPYSLYEINTSKGRKLYLSFDGKYYELKSNQTKATRLKEVKDPYTLETLKKK
jgi:hypothetical protein